MKWADIVTAISSVVSNIIALAALIISIRRRPRLRDDERVPSTPTARNPPVPSYFMTHHENKHTVRRMRHRMRSDIALARLRRESMAGRTVRTRGGNLGHRHAHQGQTGRQG